MRANQAVIICEPDEKPARILIVEDDSVTRRVVRRALQYAGYLVAEAADGVAGLDLVQSFQPDIVLLDICMPRMDGFEMCAAVRRLPRGDHIPVVMFTGLEDPHSISRAFEAGATTFVTKPIDTLNLTHRLRYIVRSKQLGDTLRERESQLARAQRIARLGYWTWDATTKLATLSTGMREVFGLADTCDGLSFAAFLRLVHPADRLAVKNTIKCGIEAGRPVSLEYRMVCPDGSERVIFQDNEIAADERGEFRLIGICQDVTERRDAESRIQHLAYFDVLTGLPNRALFKDLLERTLAEAGRHGRLAALLLLDIDHFKRINDTLGYEGGDRMLREIAERLATSLRAGDLVCRDDVDLSGCSLTELVSPSLSRPGGDEFVILLNDIRRPEDAAKAAQRAASALNAVFGIDGHEVSITASIGISVYPVDGKTPDHLLRSAEAAMYDAKEQGRNGYKFFTTTLNDRARKRFTLETALRRAIERDEFTLAFQPQIDLATRRVTGVEALLRLQTAELGFVSPADFIPVAEETGLILPIGDWVLSEAARQAMAWHAAGLPKLRMAINVSPAQFRQRGFAAHIAAILDRAGVDKRQIELELTESVLIDNTSACAATLNELAELGIMIAIDDFGTGYSSLNYLRRFPLSALKIDRSFVSDICDDADDAAIVKAVIALAHNLRLRVVAEGVETMAQLAFLLSRGCEEAQGFLFSRPVDAAALAAWLPKLPAALPHWPQRTASEG
ncbi:MAG: EAL domain-containing protein [Defluviicoccus sp.]